MGAVEIPVGLCQCGCGEPAPISPRTEPKRGYVKGQPRRFRCGHATRVRRNGLVTASDASTGPIRLIPLRDRRGHVKAYAMVDPEDYDELRHHPWHISLRRAVDGHQQGRYAARNGDGIHERAQVAMHQDVIGSADSRVEHINGDQLDNRRANLRPIVGTKYGPKGSELRRLYAEAKDAPCQDCGGRWPARVMHFHHRDPNEKLEIVSRLAQGVYGGSGAEALLAEIAKCDLLCANCHAMRHVGEV